MTLSRIRRVQRLIPRPRSLRDLSEVELDAELRRVTCKVLDAGGFPCDLAARVRSAMDDAEGPTWDAAKDEMLAFLREKHGAAETRR